MASAGRVLLISKGAWVSGTSYSPMDFVYYGGNSYVCKASVSGSTTPDSDTTHWQVMASGFDADLITQTITNDATKIASDAAVYTETQKLESNFAVIQASNVATQAFAIGDYLTYQGDLYKVTSAIANGGTITPGTNCTKTNVGTQLDLLNDSLNSATAPSKYTATAGTSVTINQQNVYKIGRVVLLTFDVTTSETLASNSNILTDVPGAIATTEFFASNPSTGETHTFYVTSAGLVRTSGSLSAGTWIANASYVSYSN